MKHITKQQLEAWLGSDADRDILLALLLQLANGEYTPAEFVADVTEYNHQ